MLAQCITLEIRSERGRSILLAFDKDIVFIQRLKFSFFDFDDSDEVADLALKSCKSVPQNPVVRASLRTLLKFQYNWTRRYLEQYTGCIALCWNGVKGRRKIFAEAAKRAGLKTVFFEISPLPGRATIDRVGVNFESSLPRVSDFYLDWQKQNQECHHHWKQVRDKIVSRADIINRNVQQIDSEERLLQGPYLFVPLQVQTDAQIRCFGGLIKSITQLVQVVNDYAKCLPPGWTIRIKEHPSSSIPYRLRELITNTDRVIVDNKTDTVRLIRGSSGVVTINSSVGIEALFFEKPILVLGQAFYGFEGVANIVNYLEEVADVFSNPARKMTFDPTAVSAFLNYLCCDYYPEISIGNDNSVSIDAAWLAEFKKNI